MAKIDVLKKQLNKIENNLTIIKLPEPNKFKVLLTRKLHRRELVRSIESKGQFVVTRIAEPDVKIDETVCILYVDRLCLRRTKKRSKSAKK